MDDYKKDFYVSIGDDLLRDHAALRKYRLQVNRETEAVIQKIAAAHESMTPDNRTRQEKQILIAEVNALEEELKKKNEQMKSISEDYRKLHERVDAYEREIHKEIHDDDGEAWKRS